MAASSESEVIAQQVSAINSRLSAVEARLAEIDAVIGRLEGAALTTARALQEISRHWDDVYEAMRRAEEPDVGQLRGEGDGSRPGKRKR
jgi:hypothetical protein